MALTLSDCKATTNSITISFSAPVNQTPAPAAASALTPGNYQVCDPGPGTFGNLTTLSATIPIQSVGPNAVAISFPSKTFNPGDRVTVIVSNVQDATNVPIGMQAIGAVVDDKPPLKIVKCEATPNNVLIFFSDQLDTPGNPAPPNVPGNYSLTPFSSTGALTPLSNTTYTAAYDALAKVTVLQMATGAQLTKGQWLVVTVSGVTSNGVLIQNGGNNTFPTRVNGDTDHDLDVADEAGLRQARAAEEGVAYPTMTEDVGLPPSSSYGTTGGGGGATGGAGGSGRISAGPAATQAISQVLGWKLNDDDPAGFVGALTQSFSLTEVDGHTQATWTPRSYTVQTDLAGGITGAQASMYARAQEALDQSVPLLNGLYALNPDADQEMIDALKDIIQSQFTELVNELGTLGGPRQFRVNQYFHLLIDLQALGSQPPTLSSGTEPDTIKGNLGRLRDELSVTSTSKFINTIDDEQDMTNFRILSDYLTSLAQTWINNYQFFGLDTKQPFLGTQLVLLSRQLSVISDTVNEVRFTLDSVFISQAERQTLQLEFTSGDPALFVEDLLQISQDFSQVEGPQLIQNAGKLGVGDGFLPVVRNLRRLVHEARNPANAHKLPDGFRTIRVRNAFDDLHDQFFELERMAAGVSRKTPPRPFQGGRARGPKK
jgi:hypothetical protein